MTTMNNILNTINEPSYVDLKCTIVNGRTWICHLNVSELAEEEVAPAINWLVTGNMDQRWQTPKMEAFLANTMDSAGKVLARLCFRNGEYDNFYAVDLISAVHEVGLCSEKCCVELITLLVQLYVDYQDGNEEALEQIFQTLYTFFAHTTPFVFDVI